MTKATATIKLEEVGGTWNVVDTSVQVFGVSDAEERDKLTLSVVEALPRTISPKPYEMIRATLNDIGEFDERCSEAKYTDTGEVWTLLAAIAQAGLAALK